MESRRAWKFEERFVSKYFYLLIWAGPPLPATCHHAQVENTAVHVGMEIFSETFFGILFIHTISYTCALYSCDHLRTCGGNCHRSTTLATLYSKFKFLFVIIRRALFNVFYGKSFLEESNFFTTLSLVPIL